MNYTSNGVISLPTQLIGEIKEIFDNKTEKNHAVRFLKYLFKHSTQENRNINTYIEIPNTYFLKVYGGRFNKWLSKLISNEIIYCNNNYSIKYNKCKSYSININKFIQTSIYSYQNILTDYGTVGYSVKYKDLDREYFEVKSMVVEDFKKLEIDYNSLLRITREEVDKLSIRNFRRDDEIEKETIEVLFKAGKNEKAYWMTKIAAINKAKELRATLIEDEDKYYIMDEFEFILMKKTSLYSSYKNCIDNLERRYYFANRNATNRRLDTNFTNMANTLTDDIWKRNGLIKLDLANAQFAILSDIFSDKLSSPDFIDFKKFSVSGKLYEYVQEKMNIEDRDKSKKLVFQLLFSKETNNTPEKQTLRELFPTVVDLVDDYKKQHGYKNFSVMLQNRESEIFIDGIWKDLKKKKYFCITKHDCIIIKKEDEDFVVDFIKKYFNNINFQGKIIKE